MNYLLSPPLFKTSFVILIEQVFFSRSVTLFMNGCMTPHYCWQIKDFAVSGSNFKLLMLQEEKKKLSRKRYDIPKTASCHVCGKTAASCYMCDSMLTTSAAKLRYDPAICRE
jgi:hypothetical protein